MSEEQKPKKPVFRPKQLTTKDIRDGCIALVGEDNTETRVCIVNEELRQGIDFIETVHRSVTMFGSARFDENNPHYKLCREISYRIGKELGYAVMSGGGPGIMEAANRGAFEAGVQSIGITIKLPFEQKTSPYITDELPFYYFFTRKVALSFSAEAYLCFPGGFGTMDEFFEILTLVQTGKISHVPIVLVGVDFWSPLVDFIKSTLLIKEQTISPEDMGLFVVTDDVDEIVDIVRKAPIRKGDEIQDEQQHIG